MRLLPGILACCLFAPAFGFADTATNLWKVPLAERDTDASAALGPDGTIYQPSFDGKLFAVNPQGTVQWTFKAGREIKSTPAVADDGTIYFGSRDRKLYAVTADGKLKWAFSSGAWVDSSPAIAADGTVYFGSWDTNFYALKPDGSVRWIFPAHGIIDSSPAVGADGTIYFGCHDRNFYAVTPDGKLKWKFTTRGQVISSPAVDRQGTIYFTSTDGNLYALDADGRERWQLNTGGTTGSSPVLGNDETIYLSVNQFECAVGRDGKKLWIYGAAIPIDATPAAADGVVYFSQPWRSVVGLTSDERLVFSVLEDNRIDSSPLITTNGTIYFTSGRDLIALAPTNAVPPAKSSWPMFRANARRTGRVEK